MKKCLPIATREIYIKRTKWYHLTLVRMTYHQPLQKSNNNLKTTNVNENGKKKKKKRPSFTAAGTIT